MSFKAITSCASQRNDTKAPVKANAKCFFEFGSDTMCFMAELVNNCPRCGAKSITFDIFGAAGFRARPYSVVEVEVFAQCRHCRKSTTFICSTSSGSSIDETSKALKQSGLIHGFRFEGYVSIRDHALSDPPEHLPDDVKACFIEAATCAQVGCFNAAGTMYRLCLDKATYGLLPEQDVDGLNAKIRRSLGFRLNWLFETKRIDPAMQELSHCVKEDGNDGAHEGTLSKDDAEDLREFTTVLLDRIYSYPERLRLAGLRREGRRNAQ